jgi:CheY-like chemotaxis protein
MLDCDWSSDVCSSDLTVFTVVLPAAPREAVPAPAPAPAPPAAPSVRRARVLVIDDEAMVSRAIVRMLRDHEVAAVASADEGLAQLAGPPPDLVLCDLMMPGRTGMDLYDTLAATRPELLPRLVFMTGGTFTERAEEFLKQHEVRVLSKPFDAATVCALAAAAVARG